jgi:putative Holliday junction resolvase
MTRILAIDYGEKRIGLALSDPLRMFAKPFQTLPNLSYENTLLVITRIISEQQVGDIVIGIPWSLDGEKSPKTIETLAFIEKISADLSVPVTGWDERYSTSEANDLLKAMGYNWKKARTVIDAMAACLILKRFMEK